MRAWGSDVNRKIVLYFTEGLTAKEIAGIMGLSLYTVFDIFHQCGITLRRTRMVYERRKQAQEVHAVRYACSIAAQKLEVSI